MLKQCLRLLLQNIFYWWTSRGWKHAAPSSWTTQVNSELDVKETTCYLSDSWMWQPPKSKRSYKNRKVGIECCAAVKRVMYHLQAERWSENHVISLNSGATNGSHEKDVKAGLWPPLPLPLDMSESFIPPCTKFLLLSSVFLLICSHRPSPWLQFIIKFITCLVSFLPSYFTLTSSSISYHGYHRACNLQSLKA